MITHEEIKRVFHYDPEIGKLIWTVATARRISVGDEAGYIGNNGYRYVQVNGEMYLAHYIIWNYQTGEWPPKDKEVDHENRIRSNNCWTNLRLLTPTFNKMNTDVRSHSGTGVKGVHLEREQHAGSIVRRLVSMAKTKYLGWFETLEEASAKYQEAVAERWKASGM